MTANSDWTPPPEPLSWTLPTPISFGSASYPTITLRAPSAGDLLKAQAIPGASNTNVNLRLIAGLSVEQVPFEALAQQAPAGLPTHLFEQMIGYFGLFSAAPLPPALAAWQEDRLAAAMAQAATQPK